MNNKKLTQVAVICFSLFAGSRSDGATTLLGVYEPDGTVKWSGEWTLRIDNVFGHDDRSMVDLGNGTYGVDGWAYYSGYYNPTIFSPFPFDRTLSTEFISVDYDPGLGFSAIWQRDNGWDYGWVFGGVSITDNNVYSTPTLPPISESIVVSSNKMRLPAILRFSSGFVGQTFVNDFGDIVQFTPAPASPAAVPEGGSTGILLGSVIAMFLGAMHVARQFR